MQSFDRLRMKVLVDEDRLEDQDAIALGQIGPAVRGRGKLTDDWAVDTIPTNSEALCPPEITPKVWRTYVCTA